MNAVRWILFAGLLLLAAASITVYVLGRRTESGAKTAAGATRHYCPMHPSYTADRAGECPICGMSLEPMPASMDGHEADAGDEVGGGAAHPQVPGSGGGADRPRDERRDVATRLSAGES